MIGIPKFEVLEHLLKGAIAYSGGSLPQEHALVWDRYLAMLLERGLISVDDHSRLRDMLPRDIPSAASKKS